MSADSCWKCHATFSRIDHREGEICPSCGASPQHATAPVAAPVTAPVVEQYHPITWHYHPEDGARPKGE